MNETRPKRRKDKYNPYTITKKNDRYLLLFEDGQGTSHCYEIDKSLYDLFDSFELEDLSYLNVWDRNIEQSDMTEASLYNRVFEQAVSVEDTVIASIQKESLHRAIAMLPEKQRRRLCLYYFSGLTYQRIAEIEICTFQAVAQSVMAAERTLKKILFQGG